MLTLALCYTRRQLDFYPLAMTRLEQERAHKAFENTKLKKEDGCRAYVEPQPVGAFGGLFDNLDVLAGTARRNTCCAW